MDRLLQALSADILKQIARGPGVNERADELGILESREHQHRYVRVPLRHRLYQRQAVHHRHPGIAEHHLGLTGGDPGERLPAVSRLTHEVDAVEGLEHQGQPTTKELMVIDDEDSHGGPAGHGLAAHAAGTCSASLNPPSIPPCGEVVTLPPRACARSVSEGMP